MQRIVTTTKELKDKNSKKYSYLIQIIFRTGGQKNVFFL
jgi:hypothetical protein